MAAPPGVVEFGGEGPDILLLHGLMGRATTWWQVAQWLRPYGRVVGLDARSHGRSPHRGGPWRTEDFVDDAAALITTPAVVIGHSMGAIHAMALAATYPDRVMAAVCEEVALDQRGKTVDKWRAYFESWPAPFESLAHIRQFFGTLGDYFTECFEERDGGYHLIANLEELYTIAAEWGERDFWPMADKIRCPLLVIEAEHSAMPPGQMAELANRTGGTHIRIPGSGHVVHEDRPEAYRGAVEAFLSGVMGR
jgi:pimeloyl-ACP methyl ester carboxylesterase